MVEITIIWTMITYHLMLILLGKMPGIDLIVFTNLKNIIAIKNSINIFKPSIF